MVRVRSAQGHQVGERHHRHVPRARARPGSAYVLLHHYMGEIDGAFRAWGFQKGGTGAISESDRERGARARRRDPHRRRGRARDRARTAARPAWRSRAARRSRADLVVSGLDPRLTFTRLVDPKELPDDLVEGVRRYKFRGSSGKVNLALSACPTSPACPGTGRTCAARSRSARASTTWSAPTTTPSTASSRGIPTWTS